MADAADPAETPPDPSRIVRLRQRAGTSFDEAVERFPVLRSVLAANDRETASGGVLLAGGLAYRLFFWLVPLGLLLASLATFFTSPDASELESTADEKGLAGVSARAASEAIKANQDHRYYILFLALGVTVWTGYGVVRAMNIVYALAWDQTPPKVRRPLLAGTAFTVITVVLAASAAALGVAISWIGLGPLAEGTAVVVTYAGVAMGVSWLFPHADASWKALIPGSLLFSAGAIALHLVVTLYLAPKLGRSVDVYGVLGASVVILLWLYLYARLITLAAFLNATLWMRRQEEAAG